MAISSINSISKSYEQLSSMKKINSAADNAAGLAIVEKMNSQTNGYDVGNSNGKAGQDLIKTAEGGLASIQDNLQRIRELAVQASNGIYAPEDKEAIQKEVEQLKQGIQDAARGTEFNTLKLLDGSMADMDLALNPDGTGMEIQMYNSTLESLGIADFDVTGSFSIEDIDKAIEYLREKGLAASAKKAGRIAAEGMAYATVIDGVGVVVEVNAETDFVGKNEKFVDFVKGVAAVVAKENPADLEALMATKYNDTLTVEQQQQEMVLVIGENIKVRRFARFAEGVSVAYVHAGGKIGVLVNVETDLTYEQVEEAGKDAAMQIAALNPRFWDKSQVTEEVLEEEKRLMMVQMANDPKMANKPEQVREKIVMGKLNKFYSENCLLQQEFVKDNALTVEKYIAACAKELGVTVSFKDAVRFEKGEGIEKKVEDYAAEVAKLAGTAN